MDYIFLDGVIEIAKSAIETAHRIALLREQDIAKISSMNKTSSFTKGILIFLHKKHGRK